MRRAAGRAAGVSELPPALAVCRQGDRCGARRRARTRPGLHLVELEQDGGLDAVGARGTVIVGGRLLPGLALEPGARAHGAPRNAAARPRGGPGLTRAQVMEVRRGRVWIGAIRPTRRRRARVWGARIARRAPAAPPQPGRARTVPPAHPPPPASPAPAPARTRTSCWRTPAGGPAPQVVPDRPRASHERPRAAARGEDHTGGAERAGTWACARPCDTGCALGGPRRRRAWARAISAGASVRWSGRGRGAADVSKGATNGSCHAAHARARGPQPARLSRGAVNSWEPSSMCAGSWLMSPTDGSTTLRLRLPGLVALQGGRRSQERPT